MARPIPNNRQIRARVLSGFENDAKSLFQDAADRIGGVILRAMGSDGAIPMDADHGIAVQAGQIVQGLFVDSAQHAFAVDGVTALAEYPRLLNVAYVRVVAETLRAHQAWMKKNVPEDVYGYLETVKSRPIPTLTPNPSSTGGERGLTSRGAVGQINPGGRNRSHPYRTSVTEAENPFLRRPGESDEAFKARLDRLRIFVPNPLAEYDPMHEWVDPNGYDLSRRIWNNAQEARDKLDQMIRDAIRNGTSAEQLAKQVEQWLLPGLKGWRTRKPYGRDGSYPAMRLARTEIARASNHAAYMAALMNPYVDRYDVARSLNGDPTCLVCPQHATIDLYGQRVREPYQISEGDYPVYHPHCVTPGQLVETKRGAIPIEQVVAGDYVLTHTGQYQRVIDAWSQEYSGPICLFFTDNGQLMVTPEHPVLCKSGGPFDPPEFLAADEITSSLQLVYPNPRKSGGPLIRCNSSIREIIKDRYVGLVYNMEVETDNSYTVNGAVVHNCMCHVRPVVADDADTITAQLRAAMEDARAEYLEPYLTPVQIDTLLEQLLGRALMDLLAQVDQLPLL